MKQVSRVHSWFAAFHLLLVLAVSLFLSGCTSSSTSQGGGTPALQAPQITAQPVGTAAYIGDTATLTVTATGSSPLTYDWRRNGTTLGAASTSTYVTAPLTSADDATVYTVVVSNAAGSVTSSGAKLSVAPKPVQVTTAPQNVSVAEGKNASFSVSVTGSAPITYQWRQNGAVISGATQSSYTFPAAKLTDSGKTFSVTISNAAGAITTPAATLTVTTAMVSITMQPASATRFVGETATFSVNASGSSPTYQWRKNGAAIAGATDSIYTTPALVATDDKASFDVVVANSTNSIASAAAVLSVGPFATAYKDINGVTLNLFAWPGDKNAILSSSAALDPASMRSFLKIADAVYGYYADAVGKEPSLYVQYDGKATIAQVPSTCGAGCTYIGATGMELLSPPYFDNIFAEAAQGQVDQVLAYEFGRSFWLFGSQLEYKTPDNSSCIVTGYAVLMRYEAIDGLGLPGVSTTVAGYNQAYSETKALVDGYQADSSLSWNNTILNTAYRVPSNKYGCSDLFASFVMRLAQNYGGQTFVKALWKEALKRPAATTTQDAVDNFILAASAAANHNLTAVFHDTWRWPVSVSAANEATSRFGPP